VSGWFESASSWDGFEKFWQGELLAMKKIGVQIRQAPQLIVAEPWQAVAYDVELPKGSSANVRAELVRAGTWVDVHISVTSDDSPVAAREHAVTFLKSVLIKERQ
jgi:methionine aminopeptidase